MQKRKKKKKDPNQQDTEGRASRFHDLLCATRNQEKSGTKEHIKGN